VNIDRVIFVTELIEANILLVKLGGTTIITIRPNEVDFFVDFIVFLYFVEVKKVDLDQIQKEVLLNKINKGFNTTDICKEFCLLYGEVGEAYEAYRKKKADLGEELADIAIYLLGLSEILGFSLEKEIYKKLEINKNRKYEVVDGVLKKSN